MSREILFKAKTTSKESGEFNNMWVYGDLIHSGGKYYIHPKGNLVSVTGELGKIIVMHEVIPETICQYTGLTDKNGNKIWENDVVKNAEYENYKAIVQYGGFNCSCCNGVYGWTFESIGGYSQACDIRTPNEVEVIGNIFDNAELLKGE